MNAGRYDQRVYVERPSRGRDQYGEPVIASWELVAAVWAQVIVPTAHDASKEVAAAGRPATERICTFRLRWPLDVREGDRIVWADEAYGIEGLSVDRRAGQVIVFGRFLSGSDGR